MNVTDRAMVSAAAVMGAAWLRSRRRRYRRGARPLAPREIGTLSPFYSGDLLASVRIATVPGVADPFGYRLARRVGLGSMLDLMTVGGMAFIDTVVVVERPGRGARIGTLFHELVHVAQFRALGVRGFVREYVRGWLEHGREYRGIPLEVQAYELQARFEREPGRGYSVEREVASWVAGRSAKGRMGGPSASSG